MHLLRCTRRLFKNREFMGKHQHERIVSVETQLYTPLINNDIHYRGYPLKDLLNKCSFIQTFHLLLCGELPTKEEEEIFKCDINTGFRGNIPIDVLHNISTDNKDLFNVLVASLSLLNFVEEDPKVVYGQCLSILNNWSLRGNLDSNDAVTDFIIRLIFGMKMNEAPEGVIKLINAVLILYIDHGLTSASYAARICRSEGGSLYSGLVTAAAVHKSATFFDINSYIEIIKLTREEFKPILEHFNEKRKLPKQFHDLATSSKDHRTVLLKDFYKNEFGQEIDELLTIESLFNNKIHFRFELYLLQILTRLTKDTTHDLFFKMNILLLASRIAVFIMTIGWLSHIVEQDCIGRRLEHVSAYIGNSPRKLI